MRKLILKMSITLDGFVCGPNGEMDWFLRTRGTDSAKWVIDIVENAGVHLVGSRTFYEWTTFWPYADSPFAPGMNNIPKIVFTRSGIQDDKMAEIRARALEATKNVSLGNQQNITPTVDVLRSWAEPNVASGDLIEEITRLKELPGDYILAQGGATFAQSLVASGLIDEYRLAVHPVALGQGMPLFSQLSADLNLKLVSTLSFSAGSTGFVYQAA